MIQYQVGTAVLAVYPDGQAILQDEGATIHRSPLDEVNTKFNHQLDPDQASKMADRRLIYGVLRMCWE